MKNVALFLALLFGSSVALAEDSDISSLPGYVDFSALGANYGEPTVMVNLGASLLKLVSAMKHDDPVAEEALRSLKSVRVNVYNTDGDSSPALMQMADVRNKLSAQDWEQIVRVREPDDKVDVYVKHSEDTIHGVVVMVVDDEEAVFVNVLGDIDPAQLGAVMEHVDMDIDLDLASAEAL